MKVTGDINTTPITLHCEPSIRMGHEYHGYVRNQVVENDADGRKFDAIGRRLR